ncbi:tRNA (adenosine(37)-N6)-dimethylallyltransferase MiaA [Spiroplasma alleghenense]|uniref:tRNA dimethylallyltransferase n=1 Tax=Spiroplasma alleghenense TaxID=216931 RepID=A0A345Z3S0_9MOLU|nr:tRNA (adenosine(37)-N6)-dimethylallyltransferase MiaA [Spiroplasma alleghenense]AXK51249.1 tRNA delta(2)-isopentenylpyrophosphate transferase [Spiroplasma alleghenense]
MNNIPIILIVGPTGSGKTDLSIKIAKKLKGECINADSTQIFSGTDIATNKITTEEMEGIKHHLLSTIPVNGNYSVAQFQNEGRKVINSLLKQSIIPIIVGGTGLYINALLKKYHFQEEKYGQLYHPDLDNYSNIELWKMLNDFDSEAASKIHENNRQRLLRANSVVFERKELKTDLIKDGGEKFFSNPLIIIGLNPNRQDLHESLNSRVNKLIQRGLFEEIKKAYKENDYNENAQALKCIGGKEIVKYLKREITYEQAILDMQTANRRYARKQITWFKHQLKDIQWFEYNLKDFQKTCNLVLEYLEKVL